MHRLVCEHIEADEFPGPILGLVRQTKISSQQAFVF
jgi:hypothetical protein